jgi:hypothetical protein
METAVTAHAPIAPRPPHVPAELVRQFPYVLGAKTTADPFSFIAEFTVGRRYSGPSA